MAWIQLFIAGIFEIVWAVGMKYSEGFTKPVPSAVTIIGLIASMYLLNNAVKTLPIGTAYAIWTGIGAAGTAVIGMLFLGESREAVKIFCIFLIVAGIVGLKLFAK